MSGFPIVSAPKRRGAQLSFAGAKPQPARGRAPIVRPALRKGEARPAAAPSSCSSSFVKFRRAASSFVKRRQVLSRIPLAVSCDFKGLTQEI